MSNDAGQPVQPVGRKAAAIDPYSEFLRLPAGPRPPHLYQLLEIEIFCPHPEQIEHAVRKQFRKIKPFEEHPDRSVRNLIQDVMTHIATARVVLSDPDQKQEYDEKLAKHLDIDRDALLRERTAARLPEYDLFVTAGPTQIGTRLELVPDRTIDIGADPGCTLSLPGVRMLDRHAMLTYSGEDWILRAAGPDRLVLVNDARCEETGLAEGDAIDLGGYRLHFGRIGARRPDPATLPPPLSAVVREGPSIPEAVLNVLAPASVLIGYCDTALWQLGRSGVSLHHARIESAGPFWEIADLQSETGTLLNGEPIQREVLKHRDELTIGRFHIQIRLRK